jgi:hypothetical protein
MWVLTRDSLGADSGRFARPIRVRREWMYHSNAHWELPTSPDSVGRTPIVRETSRYVTYISENFQFDDSKEGPGLLKPKDYAGILEDEYYYHQIKYFLGTREHLLGIQEDCLRETHRVLQLVKEELGE